MREFRMPAGHNQFGLFSMDVVDADVPFPVGLDLFERYKLFANNVDNCLVSKPENWKVPFIRTHGCLFVP